MQQRIKVIAIDDDRPARDMLTGFINWQAHGCELVDVLSNARLAIQHIQANQPDIVLSDIRMPEMDGLELARWLKENAPSVNVIMMSAYADFEYARKAITNGVKHYLLKPIDENELFEIIEAISLGITRQNIVQCEAETCKGDFSPNKFIAYVNSNFSSPLSLDDLAETFYCSSSQVSRIFMRETGMTFHDYVQHARLKKACELLKQTSDKVTEISRRVGYVSEKHFIRVFKKCFSITPLVYRKRYLEETRMGQPAK